MTAVDPYALAIDLLARTEKAVHQIAALAQETSITFHIDDVVQRVEDDLPRDYPAPTTGEMTRRDMIRRMAQDIVTGKVYEDQAG